MIFEPCNVCPLPTCDGCPLAFDGTEFDENGDECEV